MNAFTLSDIFWKVSVLCEGSRGTFPPQLPVMQSNIPVHWAKQFVTATHSSRPRKMHLWVPQICGESQAQDLSP